VVLEEHVEASEERWIDDFPVQLCGRLDWISEVGAVNQPESKNASVK